MSRDLRTRVTASAHSLQFPADLHSSDGGGKVDLYVQAGTGGADPEAKPFRRRIDLWGLGLAVALARDLSPHEGDMRKFIDTRSVEVSETLAALIFTAATARLGADNPELEDTSNIVALANRLAAAGTYEVLRWIEQDSLTTTKMTSVLRHAAELRRETAQRAIGTAS